MVDEKTFKSHFLILVKLYQLRDSRFCCVFMAPSSTKLIHISIDLTFTVFSDQFSLCMSYGKICREAWLNNMKTKSLHHCMCSVAW